MRDHNSGPVKGIGALVQRGMTLIEVLVALVLISVGMLGIAALQMSSLKANKESYGRTQASVLAADILDRMRANQRGFLLNEYVVALNGTGNAGTTSGDDLLAWQTAIDRMLPDGGGIIEVDAATKIVTITIQWTERPLQERTTSIVTPQPPVQFVTRTEI